MFSVVANHFKSKGSCPTSGDTDQGQGCWNLKRVDQANALLNFVSTIKQQSGDQDDGRSEPTPDDAAEIVRESGRREV